MSIPDTLLSITTASGEIITPYSRRGIRQTLEPIPQAQQLRRNINGTLINLGQSGFQKYRTTLSCDDMDVPALDGIWPGETVTMDCIAELSYRTSGGSPSRTVVGGSSRVSGDFTFYRPQLTVMLTVPRVNIDEWNADTGWQMEFEEV